MRMEHIVKIIDHQRFASHLADGTNELVRIDSSGGSSGCTDNESTYLSNNATLEVRHRNLSYSPVRYGTLCAHDVVDDHNVVAQTVVTARDSNISEVETGSPFVMVRTMIDGLSHSPVHSTFQKTISCTERSPQGGQLQVEQERNHQLLTPHRQLLHFKSSYQTMEQQNYQAHDNGLHCCSPIDFVGAVKLNELSACSSPNLNGSKVIVVNQDADRELTTDDRTSILTDKNCGQSGGKRTCFDVGEGNVTVGVIDDISTEEIEVALNQHKHEQEQQQGQLSKQCIPSDNRRSGSSLSLNSKSSPMHGHQLPIQAQLEVTSINQHRYTKNHHSQQASYHSDSVKHNESFSVIVQQQKKELRHPRSELLSPELGIVSVEIGSESIQSGPYHPLSSANEEVSPPEFSPTSSYATLTPLQPLPPISTMSDKFAYGGHINGGGMDVSGSGGTNSRSSPSSESVEAFAGMPNQNSMGALSLCSLGSVQSPYSSYDKLPSMGISMSPPHNYNTSPSHTPTDMVVACELRTVSASPCGALSSRSGYSQSTDLHSPLPITSKTSRSMVMGVNGDSNSNLSNDTTSLEIHQTGSHKQIMNLSPPITNGNETLLADNILITGFEAAYSTHQREIMIPSTPMISVSNVRQTSRIRLHRSPISSPHSISRRAISLNLSGSYRTVNQPSVTRINSDTATPSTASLDSSDIINYSPPHRNAAAGSLSPSLPAENILETMSTNQSVHQSTAYIHTQVGSITQQPSKQLGQSEKYIHPVTGDSNLNKANVVVEENVPPNMQATFITEPRRYQPLDRESRKELLSTNTQYATNTNSRSNSSSGSIGPHSGVTTAGSGNGNSSMSRVAGVEGGNQIASTCNSDVEEINTKELAHRISSELKRYSIPQAIFAQRVLCRSQGTLSDLLRNPKPWSKLKSGRETFRRMHKWLQEPEFQRMSALRIAAAQIPQRASNTNVINGTITNSNRVGPSDISSITLINSSNCGELYIYTYTAAYMNNISYS